MKGLLFAGIAVAFFVLAWMFLRLASIFSTTEQTIKDVSGQVVPLLGKTHITVDNINSQLSQLDEAVGDVAGMTGELDQTTAVITRGVRGGVIKVSSATAGISRGLAPSSAAKSDLRGRSSVAGWGRVVAGVVIGVAGTIYATNEDVRKNLPKAARDLPDNVRRRYRSAVVGGARGLREAAGGDPARPRGTRRRQPRRARGEARSRRCPGKGIGRRCIDR